MITNEPKPITQDRIRGRARHNAEREAERELEAEQAEWRRRDAEARAQDAERVRAVEAQAVAAMRSCREL